MGATSPNNPRSPKETVTSRTLHSKMGRRGSAKIEAEIKIRTRSRNRRK